MREKVKAVLIPHRNGEVSLENRSKCGGGFDDRTAQVGAV
jgi:hypothetical protein